MNTERLISLKENFTGQRFQWVKTTDQNLLGKVVKCKDIKTQGRSFIAVFNDGSSISTDKLNRNLMMITDGMQPLSKSEVIAISGPPKVDSMSQTGPTGGGPINVPDDLKQFQTPTPNQGTGMRNNPMLENKPISQSSPPPSNMFSMFNTDETCLNISVNLKLPNKKLLKMMYESADNKETFLLDLSQYVYAKINKDIVRVSLEKTLLPTTKKTKTKASSKTEVIVTEINEKGK